MKKKKINRIFVIGKHFAIEFNWLAYCAMYLGKCVHCVTDSNFSGETLSRRSSVSHLTHDVMSSYGSYTSLSFRSASGNGEASHRNNRHSPRQHSHSHYHHRHHNHHNHGQNSSRKHQVYYQTHHALCKRAFSSGSHGGKSQ